MILIKLIATNSLASRLTTQAWVKTELNLLNKTALQEQLNLDQTT